MPSYRKIAIRIWGDERVRCLSPMPPSGQGLWFYMLTGPHTRDGLPGLYPTNTAGIRSRLGWPKPEFDRCMSELTSTVEGHEHPMVVVDNENQLILVPNAIRYNSPESINVVKYWATNFDIIPVCPTSILWLTIVDEHLKAFKEGFREGFREAFGEAFTKISCVASGKPCGTHKQEHKHKHIREEADLKSTTEVSLENIHNRAIGFVVEFIELLLKNDSKAKVPKMGTKRYRDWALDFDRLNRIDRRSWSEITAVTSWALNHSFWSTVILSPGKLRKQFSKLSMQMSNGKPGRPSVGDIQRELEDQE